MKTVAIQDVTGALRLFASIFAREPDEKLVRELMSRQAAIEEILGADPLHDLPGSDMEATVEALAVEYCRLFIGPCGHMPPVESVALGEDRFWGCSTEEVTRFYSSSGIEPTKDVHLLPDHISMELDCLALL